LEVFLATVPLNTENSKADGSQRAQSRQPIGQVARDHLLLAGLGLQMEAGVGGRSWRRRDWRGTAELGIDDSISFAFSNEHLSMDPGEIWKLEREIVRTRIYRDRLAIEQADQELAVTGYVNVRHILSVAPNRKDDGRKGALHLIHPPCTIIADELGATRLDTASQVDKGGVEMPGCLLFLGFFVELRTRRRLRGGGNGAECCSGDECHRQDRIGLHAGSPTLHQPGSIHA